MSKNVKNAHETWLQGFKPDGEKRNDSKVRTVYLPPRTNYIGWSIEQYKNRWDIIEDLLK